MTDPTVSEVFSHNRSEEIGLDVWDSFVVPHYFETLMETHITKPTIFIGGRGCGKTMLLRYLSHYSRFSTLRPQISESEIKRIGLYWKVDTQFVQHLHSRGVSDDIWHSAFGHCLALQLGREILTAMQSVAKSAFSEFTEADLGKWSAPELSDFGIETDGHHEDILHHLDAAERRFITWINNARATPLPLFLPGRQFVDSLLTAVRRIPCFSATVFQVYIDEYENLREYQQETINTALKHSAPPVVFHVAIKRNGIRTHKTEGPESISNPDDYREFDLDTHMEESFRLFAAEVFFYRLIKAKRTASVPSVLTADLLQSVSEIESRGTQAYRSEVLRAIREVFPGYELREIASQVVNTESLRQLLVRKLQMAMKQRRSPHAAEELVESVPPEVAVVLPALYSRERISEDMILEEIESLKEGRTNSFQHGPEWISNNLYGAILQLYLPHDRSCPLYAGFDAFILLSHENLRHFLELCHRSLSYKRDRATSDEPIRVTEDEQAKSAQLTSATFVREMKSFGERGAHFHAFTLRLGEVFSRLQRRASLSEPEVSQFAILGGSVQLSPETETFLKEAVKWSVLFEYHESKMKDGDSLRGAEWQLAPIFAPHFHISPRKKRKLELTETELDILIWREEAEVIRLLQQFDEPMRRSDERFLFDDGEI